MVAMGLLNQLIKDFTTLEEMPGTGVRYPKDFCRAVREERPYRLPKDFPSWAEYAEMACLSVMSPHKNVNALIWQDFLAFNGPLYCISKELLRQFQQTETDSLNSIIPEDWTLPYPALMIALPRNVVELPNKTTLQYILVRWQEDVLAFGAYDSEANSWGKVIAIKKQFDRPYQLSGIELETQNAIESIALQALMALSYIPELITDETPPKPRKPGQKTKGEKFRSPRWIGKDFTRTKRLTANTAPGHHSSPITHWRRGHWRLQACGEGRLKRVPTWIKPILVNKAD